MNLYELIAEREAGTISARGELQLIGWFLSKDGLDNLTGEFRERAAGFVEDRLLTPEGEITPRGEAWATDDDGVMTR